MKKIVTLLMSCVLLTSVLAGCGKKVEEPTPTSSTTETKANDTANEKPLERKKLRVAYHPNMGGAGTIITAKEKGFFEEQALDVEFVKFTAGPPEIAAMVSKDIDLGYIGYGATFLAIQGQVDIFLLDFLGKGDEILVRSDSGIKSVADLKGKTIATQFGTSGETLLNLALEKEGMKREDVKAINMDPAGAVTAFMSSKVDAVALWAPQTVEIKKAMGQDKVSMLVNNVSFKEKYAFPGHWVATPTWLSENKEVAVRFATAMLKAMDYKVKNMDDVVQMVAKLNGTPVDSVKLEIDTAEWMDAKTSYESFQNGNAEKWYEGLMQVFINSGKIQKVEAVKDFLNKDIVNEAYKAMTK